MRWTEFPKWGRWLADWAAQYHQNLRNMPVRAQTTPQQILNALPAAPPDQPELTSDLRAVRRGAGDGLFDATPAAVGAVGRPTDGDGGDGDARA